jgi:hypothetical protein
MKKRKSLLHIFKFIAKSCPSMCLLWTSTNLSTVATLSTKMTKMVGVHPKYNEPYPTPRMLVPSPFPPLC